MQDNSSTLVTAEALRQITNDITVRNMSLDEAKALRPLAQSLLDVIDKAAGPDHPAFVPDVPGCAPERWADVDY